MPRKKCLDINKVVGFNIRRLRLDQEMTQRELSEKVGLTRTSISNIEVGRQRLLVQALGVFADQLGVEVSELFNDKGYYEI